MYYHHHGYLDQDYYQHQSASPPSSLITQFDTDPGDSVWPHPPPLMYDEPYHHHHPVFQYHHQEISNVQNITNITMTQLTALELDNSYEEETVYNPAVENIKVNY